jgi:cytosine/adenosine deaminase-related metal-dependent hydrolase
VRTLVRDIEHLCTFDDAPSTHPGPGGTELRDAQVTVVDGVIEQVAPAGTPPPGAVDRTVDGTGLVVLPGLVNAHQHLYQGACRAVPHLERALVGPWLAGLGALVKGWHTEHRFGPDAVQAISAAVLTESLLGGVTTVADQHHFFPAGASLPYVEATVAAAHEVGVRLHACRGSITMGPDPDMTQTVDEVVAHSAGLIDALHDPRPGARVRVALAPCGPHVDALELFDELAALAADHDGVRLHTHLYEHVDTDACRDRYGRTPWEVIAEHGWAQDRTWIAHVVDVPHHEIPEMAAAGVAIAHLVAPDLRMGWGPAPLRRFLDAGCTVGFGTTGSASNDGANLLGDLRVAALAHRSTDPDDPSRWPTTRELLRAATRGSAACLGRDDLGAIAPGMRADLAGWDLRTVDRVGVHDPVAGLLLTGLSSRASLVMVEGDVLVEHGRPTCLDELEIAARARAAVPALPA